MSRRHTSSVIATTLAIFFVVTSTFLAQNSTKPVFGLKAGLNYSTIVYDGRGENVGFRTGFRVGGFISIPTGERTAIVPELFYSRKGAKNEIGNYSETLTLNYIEIPITFSTAIPLSRDIRFRVFAGPEMMLQLSGTVVAESHGNELEEDVPNLNSVTFGVLFGLGGDFRISSTNWLLVDVRGDAGLTDIREKSEASDLTFALCLGVSF